MSEVLIVGAGYVGRALSAELVRRGDTVYSLRRTRAEPTRGEVALLADVSDPQSLTKLPASVDQVVYLVSPDEGTDAAYKAAYVDGLDNLLHSELVRSGAVKRFIFASSTAVYAQADGSLVDETSPTEPTSFSGKRLLEAEGLLRGAALPIASLRFAGIYGPGRHRLVSQVLSGSARLPSTAGFTNRIHRDDCAGFIAHLLAMATCDSVYIGVDDEPVELKTVLEFIARASGSPAPRIDDSAVRGRGGNKRCSNARLHSTGYQLKFPSFREGYGDLIALALQQTAEQQQQ